MSKHNDNYDRGGSSISITPIIMIGLGIIFLLNNFGFLPWEIWSNLWKFWPILLILFGVEALVGRSSSFSGLGVLLFLIFLVPIFLILNPLTGNPLATKALQVNEPLANLTKGRFVFNFQSSNVKISSLNKGDSNLFSGSIKYSDLLPKPTVNEDKALGEGYYTFSQSTQKNLPFLSSLGNNLDFKVSQAVPLETKIETTSGVINLNLVNLKFDLIEVETSTGQVNITFTKDYSTKVYLKVGAGLVNLTIPKDTPASIKTATNLKSITIDKNRFPLTSGVYQSPNLASSQLKLQIEISGTAASVNVK